MEKKKVETKTAKVWTAVEFAEAIKNFKPRVPFGYYVAARRAARNR